VGGNAGGRGAWHIEGAIAADAEIGAGSRGSAPSACGEDQVFGKRRRLRRDVRRKILALIGVEDREALEEGDGFGFVAGLGGRARRSR